MHGAAFQLNKVRRLINTQGKAFHFEKPIKNEFGEPNGQTVSVVLRGVFHETTSYLNKTSTDASTLRKKASPMVLMLWESAEGLHHTDELKFNEKTYRVTEIKNLQEANLVADISLEEVQH